MNDGTRRFTANVVDRMRGHGGKNESDSEQADAFVSAPIRADGRAVFPAYLLRAAGATVSRSRRDKPLHETAGH